MTGTDGTDDTSPKQERFLLSLAEGHSVTYAAKLIRIGRRTAYNWRATDMSFAQAWDEALESGGDTWEDLLFDLAKAGNVTAVIVGLKMRGRFIERQFVHVSHADLRERLRELAPDLPEDEVELVIQESMRLLPAPSRR